VRLANHLDGDEEPLVERACTGRGLWSTSKHERPQWEVSGTTGALAIQLDVPLGG
ncbi:unnamed protein product, partial [Effrenium voratum]